MTLVTEIATWSLMALGFLLFLLQLAAREVGFYLGRRKAVRRGTEMEGVGVVVGAMLGLLAFVLALTLSFANARFSERRAATLAEANAIGTAWLRAEAIDHPRSAEITRLLRHYAEIRRDYVQAPLDAGLLAAANQETGAMQTVIWGHAMAIVRERPDPLAVALMSALNETFDTGAALRFAYAFTLPPQIFWLLTGMSLLAMLAIGFQLGIRGNPLRILTMMLTVLWTVVILNIFDLATARLGAVRTVPIAYEWALEGMLSPIAVPAQPNAR